MSWGGVALSGWDALFDNLKVAYDSDADGVLDDPGDDIVISEDFSSTGITPSYDASGNLTGDADYTFIYDAWNNLVEVQARNDADVVIGQYAYYADNRRASKVVTNRGQLDGTTYFYYDGLRVIEERNGSEAVVQQYVWGQAYVDQLLMIRGRGGTWFVHQDANWNVIALTTPGGDVAEEYQYKPYGLVRARRHIAFGDSDADGDVDSIDDTAHTAALTTYDRLFDADFDGDVSNTAGDADKIAWSNNFNEPAASTTMVVPARAFSPTSNPYLLTGRRLDAETGLYYYRARTYHPTLKTFLQRDPLGYVDSASLYQYVASRPMRSVDPLGWYGGDSAWPQGGGFVFRPMNVGEHENLREGMEGCTNRPHVDVWEGGRRVGKIEVETGVYIGDSAYESKALRWWRKVLKDTKQKERIARVKARLGLSALSAIAFTMYVEYAEAMDIVADYYRELLEAVRDGDLARADRIVEKIADKMLDRNLALAYLKFLEDWYGKNGWEKQIADANRKRKEKELKEKIQEEEEKAKHALPVGP